MQPIGFNSLCIDRWSNRWQKMFIPLVKSKFHTASFQELSFCGIDSREDASPTTTILTSSSLRSTEPSYPHNLHLFLAPLQSYSSVTLYLEWLYCLVFVFFLNGKIPSEHFFETSFMFSLQKWHSIREAINFWLFSKKDLSLLTSNKSSSNFVWPFLSVFSC